MNEDKPTQYRIVHLMYLITMLASSMATFGAIGFVVGLGVCAFWGRKLFSWSLAECFVVIAILIIMLGLFLPARQSVPRGSTSYCQFHITRIGLALENYHRKHGAYPPAYLADANGKPLHSWRVLILPFLDEQTLYDQYDFSEPWNGPNNIQLLDKTPRVYACPDTEHFHQQRQEFCTSYLAVVGQKTAWPGATGRKKSEIKDTMSLLLVECDEPNIPWLQPRDLSYDQAIELLPATDPDSFRGHKQEGFFYNLLGTRHVLTPQLSTYEVGYGVDQNVWASLIDIDDGVTWNSRTSEGSTNSRGPLKIGNCLRLSLFLILALFPLPRILIKLWAIPAPSDQSKPDPEHA
ncbi:MAG: hypothetical protein COA78_32735 [Blastopirellula sp.]|nr:MAG: hypothetical protein COA78_32735 [Blastopirellula sp.]